MLLEKLFALIYVFKAKQWQTKKNALIIVSSVIIIGILASCPAIVIYKIYYSPNFLTGQGCLPSKDYTITCWLYIIISVLGLNFCPNLLIFVLIILLSCKLFSISRNRKSLCIVRVNNDSQRNRNNDLNSKKINAAITIIGICVLNLLNYIPASGFGTLYVLEDLVPILSTEKLMSIVRFLFSITIIFHLSNIYLYTFSIQSFRRTLFSQWWRNQNVQNRFVIENHNMVNLSSRPTNSIEILPVPFHSTKLSTRN